MKKSPARIIIINEDKWTYQLVSKKEFKKRHPEAKDEIAMTDPTRFTIDFTKEAVTEVYCVHEAFHAYHVYFFLNSAQIDIHTHEEIIAEFLGNKIGELQRKGRQMYKNLKGDLDGRKKTRSGEGADKSHPVNIYHDDGTSICLRSE